MRSGAVAVALAVSVLVYDPRAPAISSKNVAFTFVSLSLGCWALAGALQSKRLVVPTATVPWLLLAGWLCLSLLWSDHPSAAGVVSLMAAGVLMVTLAQLDARREIAHRCAQLIVGASAMATLLMAVHGSGMELHGGHGNPNWLGIVLACNLAVLYQHRTRADAIVGVLGLIALLLSQSLTAWVALLVAWLFIGRVPFGGSRRWKLLVIAPVVAVVWWGREALLGRWWIWKASAHAATTSPLYGQGEGSFHEAFLSAQGHTLAALPLRDASLRFTNATSAHNDAMQLLVVGGVVAVLLFALTLRLAGRRGRPGHVAYRGTVLVFAVTTLADHTLALPAALLPLCFAAADTPALRARRLDPLLLAAPVIATIVLLMSATTTWLSERAVADARQAPFDQRLGHIDRALRYRSHGEAQLIAGQVWLEMGHPDRALDHLLRSRELLPNLGTDVSIGNAYMQLDQAGSASAAYRRALRRHPAYFRAHANLVESLRRQGDFEGASAHLSAARQLQPHHPKLAVMSERLRRSIIDKETR